MPTPLTRRQALTTLSATTALSLLPRTARADDKPTKEKIFQPLPNGAGYYKFKLGDLDVYAFGDGNGATPPFPLWGENASQDAVEKTLADDFLDPKSAAMTFNVPLVRTSKGVVLFDTGNGEAGQSWGAGKLMRHLAFAGIQPDEVIAVVMTHLHGDHVGGLSNADGKLNFPTARYYIQKNEADFWTSAAPDFSGSKLDADTKKNFIANAAGAFAKIKANAELIDGPKEIIPGVRVEPAFGHTPGHQIAHLSSAGKELLLITDCVHHHCLSLRNPAWHVRYDTDAKKGAETRTRMLDRAATDKALVLAYHMPFPGLGHVRKQGAGFEWVPAEWTW